MLSDALAGKRVEVAVNESAYWRSFGGDQSPEDLETALQLVYRCVWVAGAASCPSQISNKYTGCADITQLCVHCRLFTERVEAVDSRLATCKRSVVFPATQVVHYRVNFGHNHEATPSSGAGSHGSRSHRKYATPSTPGASVSDFSTTVRLQTLAFEHVCI